MYTLCDFCLLTGVCIEVTVLDTVLLSNAAGTIGIIMDHLYIEIVNAMKYVY